MKNRKVLIAVLVGVLVLLLGGIGYFGVQMLNGDTVLSVYRRQVDLGDKYLAEQDYQSAIAAYRTAIEEDDADETVFYKLAVVFFDLEQTENARKVLMLGINRTNGATLIQLYTTYFGPYKPEMTNVIAATSQEEANEDVKAPPSTNVGTNDSVFSVIANYTLSDFKIKYNTASSRIVNNVYELTFSNFNGTLYFYNEDNATVIDSAVKQPFSYVRPNYIQFNDLGDLFYNLNDTTVYTIQDLQNWGIAATGVSYDTSVGYHLRFDRSHCEFMISSTKEGDFTKSSWCRVSSAYGLGAETPGSDEAFSVFINLIDATTGDRIPDATVVITSPTAGLLDNPITVISNGYGEITVDLRAGEYRLRVSAIGFVDDVFELTVFQSGETDINEISLSPVLSEGQMRIVLSWGSTPRDLDSHLKLEDGTGEISFLKKKIEGVAELDIDDMSGFGPETITVYDISKSFTYFVRKYSSDGTLGESQATVKVYLPDGVVHTYNVPAGFTEKDWTVFRIENGNLVDVNSGY